VRSYIQIAYSSILTLCVVALTVASHFFAILLLQCKIHVWLALTVTPSIRITFKECNYYQPPFFLVAAALLYATDDTRLFPPPSINARPHNQINFILNIISHKLASKSDKIRKLIQVVTMVMMLGVLL